ncbi:helix-turn-helix transcriptional regulator [Lactococcus sp. S64]|uniref:helix-turn-helix domain-containing protein n=1 Tax=Lactococcus sp. S64 TaxID=2767459 RepID=UPI00190320C4|nr:helix-turn-helix transcriptional regulator [Lactococcus sp. S64]MBK0083038.1 helix-turn-helix transcriptional regulator [Lactococcus sp. S64]
MEEEKISIKTNIFWERLTELIKMSGKSMNCIERELNYSRNALHNYKQGTEPSGSRLLELADYFNVLPEYLIGKSEKRNSIVSKIIFEDLSNKEKYRLFKTSQKWMEQNWIEVTQLKKS